MISEKKDRPFKPSWIDGLDEWLGGLPVQPEVSYVVLGLALVMVQWFFLLLERGTSANELVPVIVFNGLAVPYLLALIRLLDKQALRSLTGMRPVLRMSQEEYAAYTFKIANMPFLAPLLAGLAMTVFAILFPLVATEPERYAALEQFSLFTTVYHIIDKSSAFLFGVVVYHTIRQLRLVNTITAKHIQVNIFQLRPVQAFSSLTAATALGLVVFFYGWILINPELLADPAILVVSTLFTILAVLVFVWPLWGVHRLMVSEKERALHELEQRQEEIFAKFNQHVANDDYAAAEKLNGTILSLDIQYKKIDAVPTWPWRSETARGVLTAVALPVFLMIVQFFVQRALGQ